MTPQPSPGEGPGLTGTDERVARAICRAYAGTGIWPKEVAGGVYTLDDEVENAWDLWLPEARAAILALSPSPQESVYKGLLERLVAAYDDPGGDMAEEAFRVVHEMKALATEEPTT